MEISRARQNKVLMANISTGQVARLELRDPGGLVPEDLCQFHLISSGKDGSTGKPLWEEGRRQHTSAFWRATRGGHMLKPPMRHRGGSGTIMRRRNADKRVRVATRAPVRTSLGNKARGAVSAGCPRELPQLENEARAEPLAHGGDGRRESARTHARQRNPVSTPPRAATRRKCRTGGRGGRGYRPVGRMSRVWKARMSWGWLRSGHVSRAFPRPGHFRKPSNMGKVRRH
ncbi:hypothetical protein B0T16DRAFT_446653 [Cercophora newfieldiana]|uniref:Uncharacterized protein n=1 Tax=Cercophora newfieldiana TaxID=92897 RepID=A0AA39Y902_9PEZI|nr:hypothetical protein B0T16DRAFT_446653 [Cercophora newfieldiana]